MVWGDKNVLSEAERLERRQGSHAKGDSRDAGHRPESVQHIRNRQAGDTDTLCGGVGTLLQYLCRLHSRADQQPEAVQWVEMYDAAR